MERKAVVFIDGINVGAMSVERYMSILASRPGWLRLNLAELGQNHLLIYRFINAVAAAAALLIVIAVVSAFLPTRSPNQDLQQVFSAISQLANIIGAAICVIATVTIQGLARVLKTRGMNLTKLERIGIVTPLKAHHHRLIRFEIGCPVKGLLEVRICFILDPRHMKSPVS